MTQNTPAKEFPIAEAGNPLCSILRPKNPSPAEELAVEELGRYLNQITGAEFEVVDETDGPAIVVSKRDSLAALVPRVETPDLFPDGYWIETAGDDLLVVGVGERGVLHAVYALLQHLGCLWAAPAFDFYHGSHEFVPKNPSLRISLDEAVVEKPVLKYRKLYVEEGHSHTDRNLLQLIEWMPKRRFNTLVIPIDYQGQGRVKWDNWRDALTPELQRRGITIEVGGHGYENFLNAGMVAGSQPMEGSSSVESESASPSGERSPDGESGRETLFEKHPEWFGMNGKGERERGHRRVFCTSNAAAVDYLVGNVLRYLESRPEIDIFDFWPPDGCRWCECDSCKDMGEPPERHAKIVSQVSEAVRGVRPDVKFECIAYASYVEPPKETMIGEAVLVDFCPINQCFEYQIHDEESDRNAEYVRYLREWRERFKGDLSVYSYYRKYAWNSLPNVFPHYVQNDLRFYRDLGVDGISSYAEPGDWGTYELNHYCLGALAWNPDADVEARIDEFARVRFGAEAGTAKEAYAALAEGTRRVSSIPFTSRKSPEAYEEARRAFEHVRGNVLRAKMETGDESVRAALGRLELMLDYLLRDIALLGAQAEGKDDGEREKMVDSLLEFIDEHKDTGVFLYQRIRRPELIRRYGIEATSE